MPTSHVSRWTTFLALVLSAHGRAWAADAAAVAVGPVAESDGMAIVAVGDPPGGPSPVLTELAHQLRAACRERAAGVSSARELGERLGLAPTSVPELERTYAAAQAAFQADELDTTLRLLRGVLVALERSEEGAAAYDLRLRVHLRIAAAERALGHREGMVETMARVLALEPAYAVDPDQYAPSFRRDFEEVRRAAALAERHALTIHAHADGLVVYVEGKEVGPAPARIRLPSGRYRVTAATRSPASPATVGVLRTPAVVVAIGDADREIVLDTALVGALRLVGGPVLAVERADRPAAAHALGRWAAAARVITVELARDAEGTVLVASLYEAAAGALLREGRARVRDGAVAPSVVGALASYLVGGNAPASGPGVMRRGSTLVLDTEQWAAPAPRRPWLRPSAYAAGALAVGAAALAVLQARAAADAYRDAGGMVRADGALLPGLDRARYDGAIGSGDAARRGAYIAAGASAAFAITAAVLGYLSLDARGAPVVGFRF